MERELAHTLVSQLKSAGVDAAATGAGVHWQVDTVAVASRTLRVHCFWYDQEIAGLMLGMNPANARHRSRRMRTPNKGSEYSVILNEHGARVADGRTHDVTNVLACARAWLTHGDIERLVREVPFIGEKDRAMRALASRLDPELRWDIEPDHGYELWVYGGERSCNVLAGDDAVECSFFLGQARVGLGIDLGDIPAAVAAWLIARVPVRLLATHVRGVELEPYAEVLETDPPRWHWLHVRDRISDPSDVLAPLRDLIEKLATNPVARAFYSYSSLYWLCFSASSHYPWVDDGLPRVAPAGDGTYAVGETICGLDDAVQLIQSVLEAFPVRPFFGSAPHHELPLLAACLKRQGSKLAPQLQQHRWWYRLVVRNAAGSRRCRVDGYYVTFLEAEHQLGALWPSLEDSVSAIRRYCEEGASLDEIAADQRRLDKR